MFGTGWKRILNERGVNEMTHPRTGRLFALFIIYNLGLAGAIVFSYDHTTAKMGGFLILGNVAFAMLFYIALNQARRPYYD